MTWNYFGQNFGRDFRSRLHDLECLLSILVLSVAMQDLQDHLALTGMYAEKKKLSCGFWQHAETKISAGPSHITQPAKLNKMVQYLSTIGLYNNTVVSTIPTENILIYNRYYYWSTNMKVINPFIQMGDLLYSPYHYNPSEWSNQKKISMDGLYTHWQGLGMGEGCKRYLEGWSWSFYFTLLFNWLSSWSRIQMIFNNISLWHNFLHSRSYKWHGRKRRILPGLRCIRTLSKMA